MYSIRERLIQTMSLRGLRQADIIERTGMSSSTISQYISGRNEPKRKAIAILAEALDVNPSWLMGLDVPMERSDAMQVTKAEQDLINLFRQLDSEDRVKIMERIAVFLEADKYAKKGEEAG